MYPMLLLPAGLSDRLLKAGDSLVQVAWHPRNHECERNISNGSTATVSVNADAYALQCSRGGCCHSCWYTKRQPRKL